MVFAMMQVEGFLAHVFRAKSRLGVRQGRQFESHGYPPLLAPAGGDGCDVWSVSRPVNLAHAGL